MCPPGAQLEDAAQSSHCLRAQQGLPLAPVWPASEHLERHDDGSEFTHICAGSQLPSRHLVRNDVRVPGPLFSSV